MLVLLLGQQRGRCAVGIPIKYLQTPFNNNNDHISYLFFKFLNKQEQQKCSTFKYDFILILNVYVWFQDQHRRNLQRKQNKMVEELFQCQKRTYLMKDVIQMLSCIVQDGGRSRFRELSRYRSFLPGYHSQCWKIKFRGRVLPHYNA